MKQTTDLTEAANLAAEDLGGDALAYFLTGFHQGAKWQASYELDRVPIGEAKTPEEIKNNLAEDLAKNAMIFYEPTIEAYKDRAINSYKRGFTDGMDYTTQSIQSATLVLQQRVKELEEKLMTAGLLPWTTR